MLISDARLTRDVREACDRPARRELQQTVLQELQPGEKHSFDAGCQRIKALNFSDLQDKSAVKPVVARVAPYIKVATQYALVRTAADFEAICWRRYPRSSS